MIVTGLVLGAALLSVFGIVAAFITQRRSLAFDDRSIVTAAHLDAAIEVQRSIRKAELQRRMTGQNYWAYALLGLALLMQVAALAIDHFAHPSIAVISVGPAAFNVLASRASQRRYAQRQLDRHLRYQHGPRVTL
jgi:hypothetical protein